MTRSLRNTLLALATVAGFCVGLSAGGDLFAGDEEDLKAEKARIAKEALEKAVAKGKELWDSKELGKKSCSSCHENPDKPQLDMTTREWSYPAYSRRKRAVVTLHQKIQEMIRYQARGKPLPDDSADLGALAAYVTSLKN